MWYAHKAYRAKQKEEAAEARRDLEAAVANATELTDLSTSPSPSASVEALPPTVLPSPPLSPPLSPLVLPESVVALFKR